MSDGLVSDITDKIMPQIEEWQNRPLSEVYSIIFIDCIHFSVRDEHIVKKLAAYIILGINSDGYKEVLSITVGENESAKYWLGVLNSLKKQRSKGYSHPLRRWSYRNKRSYRHGISGYRISALHSSSSKKHIEACGRKG